MMAAPFEDPRKADMRARTIVALDAAGYEVVEHPIPIPFSEKLDLQGAILGDLQSLNGEQSRYAYYLRPEASRALPRWLSNITRAAQGSEEVRVYVVVTEKTTIIEASCRAVGAGLLRLTDENTLETIIDPTEVSYAALQKEFREKVTNLRRRLEQKVAMNRDAIKNNYSEVSRITASMDFEVRERYIASLEDADRAWERWGEETSARLDELEASQDDDEAKAVERLIVRGAVLEDEEA